MKKLISLCCLLLIGCASAAPWQPAGGPYHDDPRNFSVELPAGWMRFNSKDILLITKDGVLLQIIALERVAAGDKLHYSTMKYRQGMKAEEAAEVMIDNIKGAAKAPRLEILDRRSTEISAAPGMRILYTYEDVSGLHYQGVSVGVMKGGAFYGLHYLAPKRYYFDRDLDVFENVVKSFRIPS
jgi:hypothetical protein